jgi:hypothetical protein
MTMVPNGGKARVLKKSLKLCDFQENLIARSATARAATALQQDESAHLIQFQPKSRHQ